MDKESELILKENIEELKNNERKKEELREELRLAIANYPDNISFIDNINKRNKDIFIEKMAFSMFCMYYYKFRFMLEQEDYLIKLTIIELKELWKLGKLKNKLNYFFSLAKKFYEVDFNK